MVLNFHAQNKDKEKKRAYVSIVKIKNRPVVWATTLSTIKANCSSTSSKVTTAANGEKSAIKGAAPTSETQNRMTGILT